MAAIPEFIDKGAKVLNETLQLITDVSQIDVLFDPKLLRDVKFREVSPVDEGKVSPLT